MCDTNPNHAESRTYINIASNSTPGRVTFYKSLPLSPKSYAEALKNTKTNVFNCGKNINNAANNDIDDFNGLISEIK